MESPGPGGYFFDELKREESAYSSLIGSKPEELSSNATEFIIANQESLKIWLASDYLMFRIMKILSEKRVISYRINDFPDYVNYIYGEFLREFFITDRNKFRGKEFPSQEEDQNDILKEEISYVNPDLIINFGSKSLESLESIGDLDEKGKKITKLQGKYIKMMFNRKVITILPLIHFAGQGKPWWKKGSMKKLLDLEEYPPK